MGFPLWDPMGRFWTLNPVKLVKRTMFSREQWKKGPWMFRVYRAWKTTQLLCVFLLKLHAIWFWCITEAPGRIIELHWCLKADEIWNEQWKNTWLFTLYRGWKTTQLYGDDFISHYKDPYKPTRKWKARGFFSWLTWKKRYSHDLVTISDGRVNKTQPKSPTWDLFF